MQIAGTLGSHKASVSRALEPNEAFRSGQPETLNMWVRVWDELLTFRIHVVDSRVTDYMYTDNTSVYLMPKIFRHAG